MKRGRMSADERAHARLLDSWQWQPEYGQPIGCVATTFTFDAAHFEEHCLARFLGIQSDPSAGARDVVSGGRSDRGDRRELIRDQVAHYLVERDERLSQAFACVLVDRAHVSPLRSLRWHLLPVHVERGGIQHAKVSLLVWERRIRVLVGSANLTAPGYRSNVENMAVLEFTRDGEIPLALLHDVIALLDDIRRRAPGHGASDGPQPQLDRFLRGVEATIASWADPPWRRGEPAASLVCTGPGRPSLFDHLAVQWIDGGGPMREIWIMSPFFEDRDDAFATVLALLMLLPRQGKIAVHLAGTGRRLPDGAIEMDMPAGLAALWRPHSMLHIHRVVSEQDELRALHAKSIWIAGDRHALFCVGSSNFTAAGTGWEAASPANIEANVVYAIPSIRDEFGRVCEAGYPPLEELDAEDDEVRFIASASRTTEPESHALLPVCFGAALYRMGDAGPELDLELLAAPPEGVAIRDADHHPLEVTDWTRTAYPARVRVVWPHRRPPSHVLVAWSEDSAERVAIWVVNVADPAALPAPDALRELTLDELLEVLVSASPTHEAIGRILRRRVNRAAKDAARELEVDPHRKVDTRGFLLKRMRRVSAALEELKARIERPVYMREALAARLRGPLGPVALAKRLVTDDPDSAAFLIAEIALTLHAAELQPRGDLSTDEAARALREVIAELRALVADHPAPANLAAYVASTFAELAESAEVVR